MRVLFPIIAPVAATAGNLLVIWPGHPSLTITVTDHTGRRALRWKYVPDGALYGQLLILDADGLAVCLQPSHRAVLRDLARSA